MFADIPIPRKPFPSPGGLFDRTGGQWLVVDVDGYPIQWCGVTRYEGLYFLGMPWLHSRRSGILFGVGDDAAHVAAHIESVTKRRSQCLFPSDDCEELTETVDI